MRLVGLILGCVALTATAFALGAELASRERPAARVRAALAEPDPLARTAALVPVLRALRENDLDEVVAAYEATFRGVGPGTTPFRLLVETWADLDPGGAFERISGWPSERRSGALPALVRAWARRDPWAAREKAATVADEGEAMQAVYSGWAESGDPQLWKVVMNLPPGMERESASIVLMQWIVARGDFEALLAQVEGLPDDAPRGFKLAAFRTATGLVADHDPERALAFANRHAGGPFDRGLLRRVAVRWVQRDGPGAMQRLLDRPPGAERDWALREAYRRWLRRDREAARTWMPDGAASNPRFLPILDVYAMAVAYADRDHPEQALARAIAWAENIADTEKRKQTLVRLGALWLRREPDAARVWLAERGFEADAQAEVNRHRWLVGNTAGDRGPASYGVPQASPD